MHWFGSGVAGKELRSRLEMCGRSGRLPIAGSLLMFSTHFEDVPYIVAGWGAVLRTVVQEAEAASFTFLQQPFTAEVLASTLPKVVSGS
jgi:hypothetical protein